MAERMITVRGVQLCAESFGDPGQPPVLLIMGTRASMLWWEEEFCLKLAAGGRFVIRYDHRDTGRSATYEPGHPGYDSGDLVEDAVGVLDAFAIQTAHLVGVSAGGALAQLAALDHPDRASTLTLISTTFALSTPGSRGLPGPTREFISFLQAAHPDWTDHDSMIDHLVSYAEMLAGGRRPFPEPEVRELVRADIHRAHNAASAQNHDLLGDAPRDRPPLASIQVPTLVVHGAADPMFPLPHGRALAEEIPGARLLVLPDSGHGVQRADWPTVAAALLRHTSGGWRAQEDRLASRALAAGDPIGWFDQLYAAGAAGAVHLGPWVREEPHPLLVEWTRARERSGHGQRAIVVGCGLGADAEHVGSLGYDTIAFDVAATAVRMARQRYPDSHVEYVTTDLLDLPDDWLAAFDLVVEVITVQALPEPPRSSAIANITRLVAPAGTLLVIASRRDDTQPDRDLPPWPLTRTDITGFARNGLRPALVEELRDSNGGLWWRAEFGRAI